MTRDHRGYVIGPVLGPTERPWPIGWESDVDDDCLHEWELVLLEPDGLHRVRVEEVVRCSTCHVPRCGQSTDDDPCDLRRHHGGPHLLESGMKNPPFDEDPVAIRFGWTSWQKAQEARRRA